MGLASRTRAGGLFASVHQQEEMVVGHALMCFSLAIFTAYSHTAFPFEDSGWTPVVKRALRSDGLGGGNRGTGFCAANAAANVGQVTLQIALLFWRVLHA